MKLLIAILSILMVGCNPPVTVITDPFNQQKLYNLEIASNKRDMIETLNGDVIIEKIILRAEKKDDKIIINQMIWTFSSNSEFKLLDDQIELSISGQIIQLKAVMLGSSIESITQTEGYSIGNISGNKFPGGFGGTAVGVGESTSKTTNKSIYSFKIAVEPSTYISFLAIDPNKDFYIKINAKTINGTLPCIWKGSCDEETKVGNGLIKEFLKFYSTLQLAQ